MDNILPSYMTPENWQKLKPILEKALEMETDARHDFLKNVCDSQELLREAWSLLEFHENEADPLDRSAFDILTENENVVTSKTFIGKQIGKYRIVSELGSGGMGTVFLAERSDGEFQHQVALKLIKSGVGSESIHRRFVTERQILATLDHANIAHLIDGGTTDDGLPYFVMEYVKGDSIIEYASNQNLSLEERLDLFLKVCTAVSFAHQNLVIHRDLKPSNILVSKDGSPKLLDFGIAKLLKTETTGNTATVHFAFTPEYASPEQIRGENLTTATDIYSLGVILYELLTGRRPFSFDDKNFGQVIQTATQTEPVRPSSAQKKGEQGVELPFRTTRLKGDLDNIVLKALNKEPQRRYTSVGYLSDDIQRHLRGLPIFARQDTWLYRTQKFTRRNPLVVGSLTFAFLFLIAGISATTYQARQANIQREKAERRFNDVRTLANSFIFEVNEKINESPIKARELLVSRSIEYLDKLSAESDPDANLQAELASAYEKIGDVQDEYFGSSMGDSAGALENHLKALSIRENLVSIAPDNLRLGLDLASSYLKIADLSVTGGNMPAALENYDKAVTTVETARNSSPNNPDVRRELARAYAKLGQGILRSGSISKSLENYEKASALMKDLSAESPNNNKFRRSVSTYAQYAAYAKLEMGKVDDAVNQFAEAFRIDEQLWLADRENLENRRNLSIAELWYGTALRYQSRFKESLHHQQNALEIQKKIYELDISNVGNMNSLADCYLELGWTRSESGKPKEAVLDLEKAIALYENVARADSNNLSALRQISFTRRHLATALAKAGNIDIATRTYQTSLRETETIIKRDEKNSEFRHDLAICLLRLAELRSNPSANLKHAIQILVKLVSESPEHRQRQIDLENAKNLLAKLN